MSTVVEIYGKEKNGTKFFIIDSPETEVSGNLTVLQNLDISGILKINNLDVSDKLTQIDALLVDLESSSGGGESDGGSGGSDGGSGGGTAVFFSATLSDSSDSDINITNLADQVVVTTLSPDNTPWGAGVDSTQKNCNSSNISWHNGEVTIPKKGVYAIQMAVYVDDKNEKLLQSSVILERQIEGSGNWLRQTEEGWVNYGDGSRYEDYAARHVVGTFMGQFNANDKLRISGYAYSRATNPEIRMTTYNGSQSYLRGYMIHELS